uniref:ABC transporter domain-containing protein n=1 Tax=Spongospora subterranea TaxID=70186 RepID=A0A0H5RDR7_9EUKA|eukprot:CRZ12148.1 hypothetical protein [Spongospora subterranea]
MISKIDIFRTGCGKSSLFSALASLYPIIRGSIIVDGIRLANLPLLSARNAVTVIPQDPVIFAGTVRSNICFGQYFSDERIWDVLEMTKMSECVKDLGGLDSDLQEGGANLSAGERQLFCMARMLARGQLKVLLCDEPTSNVDRLTGSSMVDVFLGLNATVLMIMHRLENLEKFDRIVLMDSGFITECGAPKNLLSDESSLVRQFIDRYTPA